MFIFFLIFVLNLSDFTKNNILTFRQEKLPKQTPIQGMLFLNKYKFGVARPLTTLMFCFAFFSHFHMQTCLT